MILSFENFRFFQIKINGLTRVNQDFPVLACQQGVIAMGQLPGIGYNRARLPVSRTDFALPTDKETDYAAAETK